MSALTGLISSTKGNLLQVPNSNLGFDSTVRLIQDGFGNSSALGVSTTQVNCSNVTFSGTNIGTTSGSIVFTGNVTVSGSTTLSGGITLANPSTFGTSSFTLGGNLTTSGSSALTLTTTGTTNVTLPTSGTLINTGVTTLSSLTTANALTSASSLATIGTITSGTWNGTAIDLTAYVTGTLPVNKGGSGRATLTANYALLGNGTSAMQMIAPGTSGNVLASNGTTWVSTAPTTGTLYPPSRTYLGSGSGTYTPPATALYLRVICVGGGGGGACSYGGGSITNATAGGNTLFGTSLFTANGGGPGLCVSSGPGTPGAGGTATGGDLNFSGQAGTMGGLQVGSTNAYPGGQGGNSMYAPGAGLGTPNASGAAGLTNMGGGGAGGSSPGSSFEAAVGGGGGGGYCLGYITSIDPSYSYVVGAGGAGGTLGAGGFAGGNGGSGLIIVEAFYQ